MELANKLQVSTMYGPTAREVKLIRASTARMTSMVKRYSDNTKIDGGVMQLCVDIYLEDVNKIIKREAAKGETSAFIPWDIFPMTGRQMLVDALESYGYSVHFCGGAWKHHGVNIGW